MATQAAVAAGRSRHAPLAVALRRRPTLVVDAVVGAAWAVLLALPHALHGDGYAVALAVWALMCVAMMLPSAVAAVHHVARNSLAWRRGRAMTTFAAVYVGMWVAFGAVALAGAAALAPAASTPLLAALLVLAAAYELTPLKRRALWACHRSVPLAPRGRRATRSVVRFGLHNARACVGSCWALMLPMALVTSGHLLWMAGLTALVVAQKGSRAPRRARHLAAAVLTGAAALVLALG